MAMYLNKLIRQFEIHKLSDKYCEFGATTARLDDY